MLLVKDMLSSHQAPAPFLVHAPHLCLCLAHVPNSLSRMQGLENRCVCQSSSIQAALHHSSVSLITGICCIQSKHVLSPVFSQAVELDSPSMVLPISRREGCTN